MPTLMPKQTPLLEDLLDSELPNHNIQAAFFDIDGTLLSLAGDYSEQTRGAIHMLQQRGIKTAIASGRPYFAARFLAQELGLNDPGVFCTGAHVYHPSTEQTLATSAIDNALAQNIVTSLRELGVHYELYTDEQYYIENDVRPEITRIHSEHLRQLPERVQAKGFDTIIKRGDRIVKLLAAVDCTEDQALLFALEKQYPNTHFAYAGIAAYPDWLFVSIVDKKACKAEVFDYLLKHHNIDASQVISFGDAQSDMVFLEKAGFGVAMGNASDEVKACASYVTKPVWENGVAYALQRFFNE